MSEPSDWRAPEVPSAGTEQAPPSSGWGPPPGSPPPGPYAPRPGIVPLRPLRLGELYDGAFGAVRSNPRAVLGWAAVVVVIMVVITTVAQYVFERSFLDSVGGLSSLFSDAGSSAGTDRVLRAEGADAGGLGIGSAISTAAQLIARALLSGVVTVSVSAGVLGRRVDGGALWERVRPRLLPLIGLAVLTTLITFAAVLVCLLPGAIVLGAGAATGAHAAVVTGLVLLVLGLIAGLVAAVVTGVRLLLAPPALVLEPQPVRRAIARSWLLTRRGFWRVLGTYLLAVVGLSVAAAAVNVPFSLLASALSSLVGHGGAAVATRLAVVAVGTAITSTIVYPIQAAVVALLYIDARMRTEGLDVELAQAAATPA